MPTPLLIDSDTVARLVCLRSRAAVKPIDVRAALRQIRTPTGDSLHRAQMGRLTVEVPFGFLVTFSIETGQPVGVCRHMSMSSSAAGRTPTPEAVWMVAEHLGFVGGISDCRVWLEDLRNGNKAVNVVQPLSMTARGGG